MAKSMWQNKILVCVRDKYYKEIISIVVRRLQTI